eukprot:7598831-Alexandrium_andersonii.AAC.1
MFCSKASSRRLSRSNRGCAPGRRRSAATRTGWSSGWRSHNPWRSSRFDSSGCAPNSLSSSSQGSCSASS